MVLAPATGAGGQTVAGGLREPQGQSGHRRSKKTACDTAKKCTALLQATNAARQAGTGRAEHSRASRVEMGRVETVAKAFTR